MRWLVLLIAGMALVLVACQDSGTETEPPTATADEAVEPANEDDATPVETPTDQPTETPVPPPPTNTQPPPPPTNTQPPPPPPTNTQPPPQACHPSYEGACLLIGAGDYDCAGGTGNGPNYTGRVTVVGPDKFDLDRDNDGIGCE